MSERFPGVEGHALERLKMARSAFRSAKPWNWYWPPFLDQEDREPAPEPFAHWHRQFRSVR